MEREVYEKLEEQAFELLQADPYFSSLPEPLERQHTQTIGHMRSVRSLTSLQKDVDRVAEIFDLHKDVLAHMSAVVKSLSTSCSEWIAASKALIKAKADAEKAERLEREREEKKKAAQIKREARRQAAKEEKARLAAELKGGGGGGDADGDGTKRRRVAKNMLQQLTDADPAVLIGKFPNHSMPAVETIDT